MEEINILVDLKLIVCVHAICLFYNLIIVY